MKTPFNKAKFFISAVLFLAMALGMAMPTQTARAATTWNVPGDGSNTCTVAVPSCNTIQGAVTAATAGDTINVAAGTYIENVNVNKSLTLQGASSATAIVTAAIASDHVFDVTANNVTISGFTAKGATGPGSAYAGLFIGSGMTGSNIHDNILTGNEYGILLIEPASPLTTTPGNNTFTSNTASSNSVSGIEMQNTYGNTFTNNFANSNGSQGFKLYAARHNTFTGNTANFNGTPGTGSRVGFYLVATNGGSNYNTFINNTANSNIERDGFRLRGSKYNTFTGNTASSNGRAGIRLDFNCDNTSITGNSFTNNMQYGIQIDDDGSTPVIDSTTLTVGFNNITGNTLSGILYDNSGGTIDATNNWWGCNAGPGGAGCDTVSGNVDANPWLVLGISAAPNSILPGGTSTLTADLTVNSDGVDTSALGHIPDGTNVLFNTDFGSVGSLSVIKPTTNGKATATLTADAGAGVAIVSAKVNNQTEYTAVFVTQTGTAVTGYAMVTGANPTATFGGVTASATGTGTLIVAQYAGNPADARLLGAAGQYYDIHIAPPGAFTQVIIHFCGLTMSDGIHFWNGIHWVPVSDQTFYAGCWTVTVNAFTTPNLTDLEGAVFGVGNPTVVSRIFEDVPTTYWAWSWIERLFHAGVTNGCSTIPLLYCPDNNVTRAEMAKFLLIAKQGFGYTPPAVGTSTGFADVDTSYWAAAWIKQLAAEGITTGCGGGNYCPDINVTRDEMAKFLLVALHGSGYTPPTVGMSTGFTDVATDYWAAAWIKQLAAEGITTGCGGGNYCPNGNVTRAEMAKFLVDAFNLP